MSNSKGEDLLSQETRDKIKEFEEKDKRFKDLLSELFSKNSDLAVQLDNARIERNSTLHEAKHLLREDAKTIPLSKAKTLKMGEFTVTKKQSEKFLPDSFQQTLRNNGSWDIAFSKGFLKVAIDEKLANEWIKANKLEDIYKGCKSTEELTPAVKGPKEVDPLGA